MDLSNHQRGFVVSRDLGQVAVGPDFEKSLRLFRKQVAASHILIEVKHRRREVKPSVRRRSKRRRAASRREKMLQKHIELEEKLKRRRFGR